jgi:hypothetical protein
MFVIATNNYPLYLQINFTNKTSRNVSLRNATQYKSFYDASLLIEQIKDLDFCSWFKYDKLRVIQLEDIPYPDGWDNAYNLQTHRPENERLTKLLYRDGSLKKPYSQVSGNFLQLEFDRKNNDNRYDPNWVRWMYDDDRS